MAALMLEILLTRILSVHAWYYLAFFLLSLGMLGMTAGALTVFLLPGAFGDEQIGKRMSQSSIAFAASVPASLAFLEGIPLGPSTPFLRLVTAAVAVSVPFAYAGVTLTLALTRAGLPPARAYGIDLCGAALGCVLVVPLLDHLDAPSAVIATAALGGVAAFAFAGAAGSRALAGAGIVIAMSAGFLAAWNAHAQPAAFRLRSVKGAPERAGAFSLVRWNSHSRVTVGPSFTGGAYSWGLVPRTPPEVRSARVEQRMITIDGLAATPMLRASIDPRATEHLEWDVTQLVHHVRPKGPAAVIGVGGGRDVVAAVRSGHEPVLGLELNSQIVAVHRTIYPDESPLTGLPVELVTEEARGHLTREQRRFSVIAMPMLDTWAATGGGAFSLSENGLYTVEAWKIFLSRLLPDGILSVTRWYVEDAPAEAARLVVLAQQTLFELGIAEPRRHLVMVRTQGTATLLVSPSPFGEQDLSAVEAAVERLGISVVLFPGRSAEPPLFETIAARPSAAALRAWTDAQPLDYAAPTDDRPFFFNMVRPGRWTVRQEPEGRGPGPFEGNTMATATLVHATLASALLGAITLLLPLGLRRKTLRALAPEDVGAALGYFALIGLGFMFVELGMLSRLTVFLGHPTLALSVLLGGMIFFAGLGSLSSDRLSLDASPRAAWLPIVPAFAVALLAPLTGWLTAAAAGWSTASRIALSVALVGPAAFLLGVWFPIGLTLVQTLERRVERPGLLSPWLWGINGACGVTASGLALACSMTWGISVTLLVGAGCYAALIVPFIHLRRATFLPRPAG
jgi:hypothetical protein